MDNKYFLKKYLNLRHTVNIINEKLELLKKLSWI